MGDLLRSEHVLEEPRVHEIYRWQAALCRRLLIASTGPVVVGDDLPPEHIQRYERAGIPIVSQSSELAEVAKDYWHTIPKLRRLAIGWGSPLPKLVVAADRSQWADQPPLASQTGYTVFSSLRELGYDEFSVYVLNVRGRRRGKRDEQLRKIKDLFDPIGTKWMSLGYAAHATLTRLSIPHKNIDAPPSLLSKPFKVRVEKMARQFTSKGLPKGPWFNETLPTVPVETITKLEYPLCIDTVKVPGVSEKINDHNKKLSRGMDTTIAEEARRLYVTGQVKTVAEAGRAVNYKSRGIYEVAKHQGWNEERDEHQRMKTEKYLKADADAEVKVAKTLREDSFKAAQLAMKNVLGQLGDDDYRVTPGQAKQLAETALSLAAAQVGETTDAQDALSTMSLQELVEQARLSLTRFTQSEN